MNAVTFATGLGSQDLAVLILRLLLGTFFVLARFRWVYDPSRPLDPWFNTARHKHLVQRLCTCGYSPNPYLSGFVACVEISAGMAIIVGLLTLPATMGLLSVLLFGTYCTARVKVCEQLPVDKIDCVSCYLWRVEGVYIAIAIAILALGPGHYSLDAVWTAWLQ